MSRKKLLLSLVLAVFSSLAFPAIVQASGITVAELWPSQKILPAAIGWFREWAQNIQANLTGGSTGSVLGSMAGQVFALCAFVQSAVFLLNAILRSRTERDENIEKFLFRFVRYIVFLFVALGIFSNSGYLADRINKILLEDIAPKVTAVSGASYSTGPGYNSSGDRMNPGEILKAGWRVNGFMLANASAVVQADALVENDSTSQSVAYFEGLSYNQNTWPKWVSEATGSSWINSISGAAGMLAYLVEFIISPNMWIALIAAAITLITFYYIAFQVVVAEILYFVTTAFLPLFLAFLPLRFLSPITSGFFRWWAYTLMKLFALYLILPTLLLLPEVSLAAIRGTSSFYQGTTIFGPGEFITKEFYSSSAFPYAAGDKNVAKHPFGRTDAILITTVIAFAAAGIVKVAPQKVAQFLTQRLSLEPLYQLYD